MRYIYIYIVTFFGIFSVANAQTIDSIQLPEFTLIENRLTDDNIGSKVQSFNNIKVSNFSSDNIADFLQTYSNFYIKQYGALATPTFRGTSSSHTLILWEGFPINSLTTGVYDLNLLTPSSFDNFSVIKGGSSALFGSGSIGGSIYLHDKINFIHKKNFIYSSNFNTSGLNANNIYLVFSNKKFFSSVYLNRIINKNNFEFSNTSRPNNPFQINSHAQVYSNEIKSNVAYKINSNNFLKYSFWISKNDREIPGNMTVPSSIAKQFDDSYRFLLNYSNNSKLGTLNFNNSYLIEDFIYTDKDIFSTYNTTSYFSKANFIKTFHKSKIEFEQTFNNNNVSSSSLYQKIISEINLFTLLKYNYKLNNLNFISSIRHENRNIKSQDQFKNIPILPLFSTDLRINNIKLTYLINRNFRVPTFNDKYWISSGSIGNINLLAEDSWNNEISFSFANNNLNFDFTVFSLIVDNWITWLPQDNGVWTPLNLKKVKSNGIEINSILQLNKFKTILNYSYTKTTNQIALSANDNSLDKQLRYVPKNKFNISFKYSLKNIDLLYNILYNDIVYTVSDQSNFLDDYLLNNLFLNYKNSNTRFEYAFKCKNIFNISYQSYENYPNPGREFVFNIKYKLINK